jgi:hypothetical protein
VGGMELEYEVGYLRGCLKLLAVGQEPVAILHFLLLKLVWEGARGT